MARKKLKKFTTLELMLSILLLVVFIITIPIFVLSARDSLESQGNKEVWSYPSTCCSFQSRNLINGREVSNAFMLTGVSLYVCVGDHPTQTVTAQFSSVAQSCLTPCDPTDCTPGFPVHHQLPELAQAHVH